MIAVIDYGMGNLRSVEKALELVGAKVKVTSNPADLARCDKLVFPGVGAFGDAMRELKSLRLVDPIKDAIKSGKLFLGLCLGMQLLFDDSDEAPGVKGLSVLKGGVKRFRFVKSGLKVPHMGWNSIQGTGFRVRGTGQRGQGAEILRGVPEGSYMYFVHSYYVKPKDRDVVLTTTDYGIDFVSGVCKDNIYGFQFHPEKSQDVGIKILENFVKLK
ncbi:MAG: imidazole glycerol phosphate synthase subunit HisH [Candidatus Omnitrophica bacterium]|nr:imidazole glycerol phosphate synthase subunit HisH [Candidatus Omnitrophota bacterium]